MWSTQRQATLIRQSSKQERARKEEIHQRALWELANAGGKVG